jgi:hypothetical protein
VLMNYFASSVTAQCFAQFNQKTLGLCRVAWLAAGRPADRHCRQQLTGKLSSSTTVVAIIRFYRFLTRMPSISARGAVRSFPAIYWQFSE